MGKTIVHVNMHVIRDNRKSGAREPALTLKKGSGGKVTRAHEAVARGRDGSEMFRVVYRPDDPLPCGAVCWVETTLEVTPLIQEYAMSTKSAAAPQKPAKAPAKVKAVSYDVTVTVKAPENMSASRVQRAMQRVVDEGIDRIELSSDAGDDKAIADLDQIAVGKVKATRKPANQPTQSPTPTPVEDGGGRATDV